jgi:hypothetical protein
MHYLTTIEERNGVLRIAIHEPAALGSRTVAILALLTPTATHATIGELSRIAVEALALRGL